MAEIIKGNLLDQKGLLVHQVNTDGAMGAGVALAIRRRWPEVYEQYRDFVDRYGDGVAPRLMGRVQFVWAEDGVIVANLFGQHLRVLPGGLYQRKTSYDATYDGWRRITEYADLMGLPVFAPHGIGCGLGGGDWATYSAIVDAVCPGVTFVRL